MAVRPALTEDGRWVVVDGRRWRASDPAIPAALRSELVDELMEARRAVGTARRAEDPGAEQAARRRVHDAKVALGERGNPWWEAPTAEGRTRRIDAALRALARGRGVDSSICPSDVARAVGGARWRTRMDEVRERARALAVAGEVEVLQRGRPLDPHAAWRGPLRIRPGPVDG